MERTIPQFNFDDQYLRMWRMISYAQCQDHHCVTSLLDITVRHIWNKEMRCWWYITHDGWWYLVIQQIPILIPITLTLTSSIHSPLSRCHVTCCYSWSTTTSFTFTLTWSSVGFPFNHSRNCPAVKSPTSTPDRMHQHHSFHYLPSSYLASQSLQCPHSPSWHLFALHTLNHSACLTSKYCWAVNILRQCMVSFGLCMSAAARSIYSPALYDNIL